MQNISTDLSISSKKVQGSKAVHWSQFDYPSSTKGAYRLAVQALKEHHIQMLFISSFHIFSSISPYLLIPSVFQSLKPSSILISRPLSVWRVYPSLYHNEALALCLFWVLVASRIIVGQCGWGLPLLALALNEGGLSSRRVTGVGVDEGQQWVPW